MSLTNAHTRSIGARTSNIAVPSGMLGRGTQRLSNTLQRHRQSCPRSGRRLRGSASSRNQLNKRKGPRSSPILPRRVGFARVDSTFPEKRKARALVHADLSILRHFVNRFAAFRFPLAEEVDRYFRSLLQFHVSRVQRPSLVRVRHVFPRSSIHIGVKSVSLPMSASDKNLAIAIIQS